MTEAAAPIDVVEVLHGTAAPEELAALVAVVVASAQQAPSSASLPPAAQRRSGWGNPALRLRNPLPHVGAGAWRQAVR